jgi:hypothetical protein
MSVPSLERRRQSACTVDFRSRFMLRDALRSKDEAPASFHRLLTTVLSMGYANRRLTVDNDALFLDVAFWSILDDFHIAWEVTAPCARCLDGRIGRQWGALVRMAQ